MRQGIAYALSSALLFGASTPLAKLLLGQITPLVLAGLLYLGSGVGLAAWYLLRRVHRSTQVNQTAALKIRDAPALAGAILAGGVAAPVLLMFGLTSTPASTASLLLNLEGVLTVFMAWFVFREQFDRQIFIGMLLIVLASVLLSWEQLPQPDIPWGSLAIAAACLCWAIDNNLTRSISVSDALQIAAIKGIAAALVNLSLAWALGASVPAADKIVAAGLLGLCGYGVSLVLFVLALRHLGTARTAAYFSTAPFVGAAISIVFLHEAPSPLVGLAALLMASGIWLHLSEKHRHPHFHEPLQHAHRHSHDEHHQHAHDFAWDDREPHDHPHRHETLAHSHPHFPDIHHRHAHRSS
jgi:drug/metabolite transporter (DMT)-like permease